MPTSKYNRVTGGAISYGRLSSLPKPRSSRSGSIKAILWAIICVVVLSAASFWLTRAPAEKEALRQQAANTVNDKLEGTPLAGIGDILSSSPQPPPETVLNPPTEAGTLAGRQVTGAIAAPMDFGPILPRSVEPAPEPETPAQEIKKDIKDAVAGVAGIFGADIGQEEEKVVFSQEYVPPVSEDSRVPPSYLSTLATWLVNRYRPGPGGGSIAASAQAINQEFGARLAGQAQGGRAGLLRYALQPAMVDGLYKLYIDRFMGDLDEAATKKGLDAEQNRGFHMALAGKTAVIAQGLEAVLNIPDLSARLARIDNLAQKTVDENAALAAAVVELDETSQNDAQARATVQLRVDGAAARYRRAAEEHAEAQRRLAQEIRKFSGPGLDDGSLLYMAAWVGRREAVGAQAKAALQRCAMILRDLSSRCQAAGS